MQTSCCAAKPGGTLAGGRPAEKVQVSWEAGGLWTPGP